MSLTPSTMLPLGTAAPDFSLPDAYAKSISLFKLSAEAKGTLIIFMCNHCPYVIHLKKALATLVADYQPKGIATAGLNSNDISNYPADNQSGMIEDSERFGYSFPYLLDATQEVAKAYQAACTPEFYLFDRDLKLVYRGQFDDSRPGSGKASGKDLHAAMDALLSGNPVNSSQQPSVGCNIKWKPDNTPDYS